VVVTIHYDPFCGGVKSNLTGFGKILAFFTFAKISKFPTHFGAFLQALKEGFML
jgi:hypothetical protein